MASPLSLPAVDLTPAQLLAMACASAQLRLQSELGLRPAHDDHKAWRVRAHPWIAESDRLRNLMAECGHAAQRGGGVDLRGSAYWPLLEHQDAYEQAFEHQRLITLQQLTARSIFEALLRRNRIAWSGWSIKIAQAQESTDDYGLPCWTSPVCIEHTDGAYLELDGITRNTAKQAYAFISGKAYDGSDGLGNDQPHIYERY